MLGLGKQNKVWRWNAVGKHPAAADYINLLGGSPLMEAFSDWVTKGYSDWQQRRVDTAHNGLVSWRFWLRGAKKGRLICGVGRDSSDRIGRPFPLLILGEGPLKGWEKEWIRLPSHLAATWERIERIAASRYDDLKELSGMLEGLAAPQLLSSEKPPDPPDKNLLGIEEELDQYRETLVRTGRVTIPLNAASADPCMAAAGWHARLQAYCNEPPRAVFLGGTPQRNYLAMIQQPLATADFVNLWNVQ